MSNLRISFFVKVAVNIFLRHENTHMWKSFSISRFPQSLTDLRNDSPLCRSVLHPSHLRSKEYVIHGAFLIGRNRQYFSLTRFPTVLCGSNRFY